MFKQKDKSQAILNLMGILQEKKAHDGAMEELKARKRGLESQLPGLDGAISKATELKQDALNGFCSGRCDQACVEEAGQAIAQAEAKKKQTEELIAAVNQRIERRAKDWANIEKSINRTEQLAYFELFKTLAAEIREAVGEKVDLACAALHLSGRRAWYDAALFEFFPDRPGEEKKRKALVELQNMLAGMMK